MPRVFEHWQPILVNIVTWTACAFGAGWWHRRASLERLAHDGPFLRLRHFERRGTWYEQRLHIKSWKDHLPETGGRRGGMSKRRLPGYNASDLERFAAECRRGERTHWTVIAATPSFALWNHHDTLVAMTGASVAANSPFIAILRYNRARIASIIQRHNESVDRTRSHDDVTNARS